METPRWSIYLLLCLIPLVKAYTVFETNCSAPITPANYVSSPNTRGTLDILWSSLFTILACTWTLQHPNVPEQRDGRDAGLLGDVKWGLKGLYRSTYRMLVAIIAPEMIICVACLEMLEAHQDYKTMQEKADEDRVAWSLSHCYYANMGGFVIRYSPRAASADSYKLYHLNAKAIFELREEQLLIKLPDIKTEDIKDKSKGDKLVKGIALVQILGSVLQIIVRVGRGLPVSPLEVAVVAFAVCAVIIYGLYWDKPQRAEATTTILRYEEDIPEDVLSVLGERRSISLLFLDERPPGAPIHSVSASKRVGYRGGILANAVTTLGAAVFGGIHAIAWNFAFPSTIELTFWRCASICTVATPIFVSSLQLLDHHCAYTKRVVPWGLDDFGLGLIRFCTFLYVVARLFILVEMVRTLCFLPPGSYVSTWTMNIPHVA